MVYSSWHLNQLKFTGPDDKESVLPLAAGLSLIYGASNTGKSFAMKALDFMLGGSKELPPVKERNPYNKIWLDIKFAHDQAVTLERAIRGGAFTLHEGDHMRTLGPRHTSDNLDNISMYLLSKMGCVGKKIAEDASGTHANLSFRDFAGVILTNEIKIQEEHSPIESGQHNTRTLERNVLKFMLTGEDDFAIAPVLKPKDFKTGRVAKSAMLQDMIDQLNADLVDQYPDIEDLAEQSERIDETLASIEKDIAAARSSIRALLDEKRNLSGEISRAERRLLDIALSLDSFEQLEQVYVSDIARLESLEEAGFLLGLENREECPVCGAPPEAQKHSHGTGDIDKVRVAAEAEIQKIKQQRTELLKTVEDTTAESGKLTKMIATLRTSLATIEDQIQNASPDVERHQKTLFEMIQTRDRVVRGLDMIERRDRLVNQRIAIEDSKPPKADKTIQRGLTTETAKAFADVVHDVLLSWGFPGDKVVHFDLNDFDLIIDGKERRNNGKGVRAITHAAFKVALLLFCRERNLPHPGFVVLDTPLLTYRDPFKKPGDVLADDEKALRNTDLKERFFEHLGKLGTGAQFIVFENIDPPKDIRKYALVETFTNDPNDGRQGLL